MSSTKLAFEKGCVNVSVIPVGLDSSNSWQKKWEV